MNESQPNGVHSSGSSETRLRTFIVHVEDLPGVLNRVTSLIRRRGYNIASLTVGRTHTPEVSRMTIVTTASDDDARRIEANLYKLVNVLRVEDTSNAATVTREDVYKRQALTWSMSDRMNAPQWLACARLHRAASVAWMRPVLG